MADRDRADGEEPDRPQWVQRLAPSSGPQTRLRQRLGLFAALASLLLACAAALLMLFSYTTQNPPSVPARPIDTFAWILPEVLFGPAGVAAGVFALGSSPRLALAGIIASSAVTVFPVIMLFVATLIAGP